MRGGVTEGTRVPIVAPSRGRLGQGCCSLSSTLKQILLRLSEGWAPPQTSSLPSTALLSYTQDDLPLSLSLFSLFLRLPLACAPLSCPHLTTRPGWTDPDAAGARAHRGAGAKPATGEGAGRAAAPRTSRQPGNRRRRRQCLGPPAPPSAALFYYFLSLWLLSSQFCWAFVFPFCIPSRRTVPV